MQGREEDVIVLSCVRTDLGGLGFLSDWRRVNVAISRAKEQLIVVGDPQALANNRMWREVCRRVLTYADVCWRSRRRPPSACHNKRMWREVLRRLTLLRTNPLCCELTLYATN
jgi:hypothetical protein